MQKQEKVKESMIVNSSFTSCSGEGTRMFSRQGKATINHYLCFNESASSRFNSIAIRNYYRKLQERSKQKFNCFRFQNKFIEITDQPILHENKEQPVHQSLTATSVTNRFDSVRSQRSISPPTGYYKPVYSLVDKRVLTFKMAKDTKKNTAPARETPESSPKLRRSFMRKIRLKQALNRTDNADIIHLSQKPETRISFKRRLSLKDESPGPKQSMNAHFDSSKFSDFQKLRPASSLGLRGHRFSRPESPQDSRIVGSTIKSVIDFTKQLPRDPFVDPRRGPNERRFEMLKTPKVLSSYHEPHPPQFKLSNGRLLLTKKQVYLPDYDVNMDSIGKPLGQGGIQQVSLVPRFEKFVKRKDPAILKTFSVPECYPLSQIEKGEKHLSNFTEKKLIPMQKQLPRDNRMYNINEGFNLKPKKEMLNSNQRLDSALSFYESQDETKVRSRASANKVLKGSVERKLSYKRRYSLTSKGEKGRKTPSPFKVLGKEVHDEWMQEVNRKRLKLSEIEL